jgi:hypothetical protein
VLLVGNGSLSGVWVMGVLLRSLRIILPTDARALGQSRARADVGHLPHCVRPMRGTVSGAAVNFHAVCAVDIRARPPARHTRPPKRAAASPGLPSFVFGQTAVPVRHGSDQSV